MKKSIILLIVVTLFLVGCESSASKDRDHTQSSAQHSKTSDHSNDDRSNHDEANGNKYVTTTKNEDGQVFRVISAYKWINQYVEKAKDTNSESKRFELWQNIVMDHVQDQCLSGVYSHLVEDYVYFPPKDLESLESDIKILKASHIESTTLKALKESAKKFPGPDTTVCLLLQGNSDSAGVNLDAGKISIFYSPL